MSTEGRTVVMFSKNEVYDLIAAQQNVREYGVVQENEVELEAKLTKTAVGTLGWFLFRGTALGTVSAVVRNALDLGALLAPDEKDLLSNLSDNGESWLDDRWQWMDSIGADYIEMEVPYLQYTKLSSGDGSMFFVSGKGIVQRVHTSDGWHYPA